MLLKLTPFLAGIFIAAVASSYTCAAPVSEDITWEIEQTTVSATLTIPDGRGPFPAVVLVPGSGPTDRNWNSPLIPGTNGSGRLLAEELSKNGIIVLRYDKRFTGPYAKGNMVFMYGKISLQSHMDELSGAVAMLRARKDVDQQWIFALSNSEGAIHALNYQLQREPKFAGLILTSPPGRSFKDLIHSQIGMQVAVLPNATEFMRHYDQLAKDFVDQKPFTPDTVVTDGVNNLIKSFYQPAGLPFMREIFELDPAALLGADTAPALVLIGKKDIQVDWQVDGPLLGKTAHNNIVFSYPKDADHLLKYEPKPRPELSAAGVQAGYNVPDRILDPETLKLILDWFKTNIPAAAGVPAK